MISRGAALRRAALLAVALLPTLVPGRAAAQSGPSTLPALAVEADHWIYPLLDAASAAGVARGWLPGHRPGSGRGILDALDAAVADSATPPAWGRTLESARALLLRELGLSGDRAVRLSPWLGVVAGRGPRTGTDAVAVGGDVTARWGPVTAWGSPALEVREDEVAFPWPRVGAAWEGLGVRISGRHDVLRYGPGTRGGVVAGGGSDFAALEAGLARPAQPGGWLGFLGRVQGSVAVTRLPADEYGPAVAFVAGELRVQPAEWALFQVQRSSVIAWTRDGDHPGARDFAYMLIGKHTIFDDQRLAVSARLRVRPFGVPVAPYLEWGMEDSAGMDEDPGIVLGVQLPSLPIGGVPLSARYEYAAFGDDARVLWSGICCFEPRGWYHHSTPPRSVYLDGDGDLLGHPLGGYGHEHLVEVTLPAAARGLWLRGALFVREREGRNLLIDVVPGTSRGAALDLRLYGGPLMTSVRLLHERGAEGWTRTSLRLSGTLLGG